MFNEKKAQLNSLKKYQQMIEELSSLGERKSPAQGKRFFKLKNMAETALRSFCPFERSDFTLVKTKGSSLNYRERLRSVSEKLARKIAILSQEHEKPTAKLEQPLPEPRKKISFTKIFITYKNKEFFLTGEQK
jgi:hypothetical protein